MDELHEASAAYGTLTMSEEEFVEWCDEDVRAEFVDGLVVMLLPDSSIHVRIFGLLHYVVGLFVLRRDLGEVFGPNLQIRLRAGLRRVPDLLFVSSNRLELVKENHFEGAPDVAFEIVSPDSVERDWREKYLEYESSGVREYFVIDRNQSRMELYRLIDGRYERVPPTDGIYRSQVIPSLYLHESWLLQDALADPFDILKELGILPGE